MLFLVTSSFRVSKKQQYDLIERKSGTGFQHDDQFDAGDVISIGRRDNGTELSGDEIAKNKKSPDVELVGHLTGRLLDPERQRPECLQVLIDADVRVNKEIDSFQSQIKLLDTKVQADGISKLEKKIAKFKERRAYLAKMISSAKNEAAGYRMVLPTLAAAEK